MQIRQEKLALSAEICEKTDNKNGRATMNGRQGRKRLRRGVIYVYALAVIAGQAWAGNPEPEGAVHENAQAEPAPWPQFTFKRVGLPQTNTPRINVQIDPAEQAAALQGGTSDTAATAQPLANGGADGGGFDWFWADVAADIANGGPANLARALAVLRNNPASPSPRLQDLQGIAAAHGLDILRATVGTDVSPALVVAMIAVESGGRADVVSGKGAEGLMQLIPDTAVRFGVEDASDPGESIRGGVAYMAWLMDEFTRDPILALAGYNAGENAVKNNGGVPPFAETRAYVPKVLAAWQVARGLCMTPPELITDGCVFAVKGNPDNG